MIYDRDTRESSCIKESSLLKFLYGNVFGRILLKLFTMKWFSNLVAIYMNSPLSRGRIKRFIKKNNINMDEFVDTKYKSFDDFFTRKIKEEKRVLNNDEDVLVSPCDAKISVYKIDDDTNMNIKNSNYTISELLKDDDLARKYKDGYCLVFRLCVDDYHHYSFVDDGEVVTKKRIKGRLNTVRPIAQKYKKVFSENTREYTLLKTNNYGEVIQMEVGALIVGKIVNKDIKEFKRGDEKGYFRFGGSTIILLFEKDKIEIDEDILEKSMEDVEVKIKMFESIGRRYIGD